MPTHSPASSDVAALISDVIADHYPELAEVEVTINALFAFPAKAGQPAVKLHGRPCHAVIKINGEKDRVEGKSDATMTIDGENWKEFTDAQKRALIDHEIHHLIVQKDKEGHFKSDDIGRPKLKMKLHDFEIGFFTDISRRHGEHAFETTAVRDLTNHLEQLTFTWSTKGDREAA